MGWEDPLEEGMATHSIILAWRIPADREAWQAAVHGSQRVGHDSETKRSTAGSVAKDLPAVLETQGLLQIPGSGRPPEGGNGNPLQYSCLGSPWAEEPSLTGYSPWDHKSRTRLSD